MLPNVILNDVENYQIHSVKQWKIIYAKLVDIYMPHQKVAESTHYTQNKETVLFYR
jgi:hypothetical protein